MNVTSLMTAVKDRLQHCQGNDIYTLELRNCVKVSSILYKVYIIKLQIPDHPMDDIPFLLYNVACTARPSKMSLVRYKQACKAMQRILRINVLKHVQGVVIWVSENSLQSYLY